MTPEDARSVDRRPTDAWPPDRGGSLLLFFFATYAVMWTCFGTVAVTRSGGTPLGQSLLLLGAWSPSLVAIGLTLRRLGSAGVRALVRPVVRYQVGARWYLFAAGYVVAVKLTVALIHRLWLGAWPRFGASPWYLIPFAIAFSTPFQAGEEIGWRGYALPRLAGGLGLPGASIVLGLIWGLWHLPQFFIRESDAYGQSFFVFVVEVVAISVAIAWLYMKTDGSLLLPMLLHSAVNNSKDIVPAATPGATHTFRIEASPIAWSSSAVLWTCAAFFLVSMARSKSRRALDL